MAGADYENIVRRKARRLMLRRVVSLILIILLSLRVGGYIAAYGGRLLGAAGNGFTLLASILLTVLTVSFVIWTCRKPAAWKVVAVFILGAMSALWGWDIVSKAGVMSLHLLWLVPLYGVLIAMNLMYQRPRWMKLPRRSR